jgi:8-oxo-dGTP diphosphatase
MNYKPASEEEAKFLKNYNAKDYDNPAVTVDAGIVALDDKDGKMKMLLIRRGNFPYKGYFCLPGGFVELNEDIDDAVKREMTEETGIGNAEFAQVMALGEPGRDPRHHIVTILYAAYVRMADVAAKAGDDAAEAEWFTIEDYSVRESAEGGYAVRDVSMTLKGSVTMTPKIRERVKNGSAVAGRKMEILDCGGLAFDHARETIAVYEYIIGRL